MYINHRRWSKDVLHKEYLHKNNNNDNNNFYLVLTPLNCNNGFGNYCIFPRLIKTSDRSVDSFYGSEFRPLIYDHRSSKVLTPENGQNTQHVCLVKLSARE